MDCIVMFGSLYKRKDTVVVGQVVSGQLYKIHSKSVNLHESNIYSPFIRLCEKGIINPQVDYAV